MAVLHDPLASGPRRLLRRAVLELATGEHRRHFPPVLHVGTPGGPAIAITDDPRGTTVCEPTSSARRCGPLHEPAWAWVTRPVS